MNHCRKARGKPRSSQKYFSKACEREIIKATIQGTLGTVYINGFKDWMSQDSMTFDTAGKNTYEISLSSSSTFFAVVMYTCNDLAIRPNKTDIFTRFPSPRKGSFPLTDRINK